MGQYAALIKMLAILGAAFSLFIGGCHYGKVSTKVEVYEADGKSQSALVEILTKEQARSQEMSEQIRSLMNRPAARDTIREVIRTNPSNCVRPAAVTDGLQVEIAAANKAISASRGRDTVP